MNNQYLNRNNITENSQIESQLADQDDKLQDIIEILQIILVSLNDKSASQEEKERIHLVMQALVSLDSNIKEGNTSQRDFQKSTQRSLEKIEQKNQGLQSHYPQIKQQLEKQNEMLEEFFGFKYIAMQYIIIGVVVAATTVAGIRLFPPSINSVTPSKNDLELQKNTSDKPAKTSRKSK